MKLNKKVVEGLLRKISNVASEIKLDLKENNIVKAINPEFSEDKKGEWNGYGYAKLGKHLFPANFAAVKKFLESAATKEVNEKPKKTEAEIEDAWSRRLARLAGISLESAKQIAGEKLDYRWQKIYEMRDRQNEQFSIKRDKLIKKMKRENPLRRIRDEAHASAIIKASDRHKNTDYEGKLEEGRYLAEFGIIDRGAVKEFARNAIKKD